MNQYVVRIEATGELYGPFSSWDSASTWAKDRLTIQFRILPLIYPV